MSLMDFAVKCGVFLKKTARITLLTLNQAHDVVKTKMYSKFIKIRCPTPDKSFHNLIPANYDPYRQPKNKPK